MAIEADRPVAKVREGRSGRALVQVKSQHAAGQHESSLVGRSRGKCPERAAEMFSRRGVTQDDASDNAAAAVGHDRMPHFVPRDGLQWKLAVQN